MVVLLLESYYGGSHKTFIDQLSDWIIDWGWEVKTFTLQPKHWRTRLQLSHLEIAEKLNHYLEEENPNKDELVIIGNSLMDSAALKSLLLPEFRKVPFWVYFHENQMTYPIDKRSPVKDRDIVLQEHVLPAFHLNQVITADQLIFNSQFTLKDTFQKLEQFLFTRQVKLDLKILNEARKKTAVIPVGINPCPPDCKLPWTKRTPRILWNHRWEYDKGPREFFSVVEEVFKTDSKINLSLLGENNRDKEGIFEEFRKKHSGRIYQFGFLERKDAYWKELGSCRILPVTSIHDFLGLSVLEGISAGVIPLLPNRLVYPELLPMALHEKLLYEGSPDAQIKLLLNEGLSQEENNLLENHLRKFTCSEVKKLWNLKLQSLSPIKG